MFNFRDVAAESVRSGCSIICEDVVSVTSTIQDLLKNAGRREEMASAARTLVDQNVGASKRYAEAVIAEMDKGKR